MAEYGIFRDSAWEHTGDFLTKEKAIEYIKKIMVMWRPSIAHPNSVIDDRYRPARTYLASAAPVELQVPRNGTPALDDN
jgi:hypothetical protein